MKGKWWLIYNSFPKHFLVGVAWWGGELSSLSSPKCLGCLGPECLFSSGFTRCLCLTGLTYKPAGLTTVKTPDSLRGGFNPGE